MTFECLFRSEDLLEFLTDCSNIMIVSKVLSFKPPSNDTMPGTSVTSHMGLMPEIERVWISIDHKLFLWDYNDGYVDLMLTVDL